MSRTAFFFQQMFDSIAERGREVISRTPAGAASAGDLGALCRALLAQRGEASAAALAQNLIRGYAGLDQLERARFFSFLAEELSPEPDAVARAADAYRRAPGAETLAELNRVTEPPRQELFRLMNMAPGGTATLVGLRAALLGEIGSRPELRVVDNDLLHLFSSWFNRGFLTLEGVNWRTSALLLEKLIDYEAVHAIQGWEDLRRRLTADGRCFAFFHPALPDEPLIFVEVALVKGMSASVQPLIDPRAQLRDPTKADTAIFYSINNCQKGLRGVSFGSFLIKQVAAELQAELPNLRTFATLSPVPRFREWLAGRSRTAPTGAEPEPAAAEADIEKKLDALDPLADPDAAEALRKPVSASCAGYCCTPSGRTACPMTPSPASISATAPGSSA